MHTVVRNHAKELMCLCLSDHAYSIYIYTHIFYVSCVCMYLIYTHNYKYTILLYSTMYETGDSHLNGESVHINKKFRLSNPMDLWCVLKVVRNTRFCHFHIKYKSTYSLAFEFVAKDLQPPLLARRILSVEVCTALPARGDLVTETSPLVWKVIMKSQRGLKSE